MAYTTIDKHTDFFNTKIYSGTSNSSDALTGIGHQPNFVWLKSRSNAAWHILTDSVRGVDSQLYTNSSSAAGSLTNYLESFDSDGFTINNNTDINGSGKTFVGWSWKAGTTSGLSGGTITPTGYSINTTSGFGIYKYTGNGYSGATIAHGLGKVPTMIWVKKIGANKEWQIYHRAMGNGKWIEFTTAVAQTGTSRWNDTSPTNTLFYLGNDSDVNASGGSFIAYVWCDVPGFSMMGGYGGNQITDGAFYYTGFAPAFVLFKSTQSTEHWAMHDNKRSPFPNPSDEYLYPNLNNSEAGGHSINLLSNGVKIRTDNDQWNDTKQFIFMAFGQTLVGSNNIPCTAR